MKKIRTTFGRTVEPYARGRWNRPPAFSYYRFPSLISHFVGVIRKQSRLDCRAALAMAGKFRVTAELNPCNDENRLCEGARGTTLRVRRSNSETGRPVFIYFRHPSTNFHFPFSNFHLHGRPWNAAPTTAKIFYSLVLPSNFCLLAGEQAPALRFYVAGKSGLWYNFCGIIGT